MRSYSSSLNSCHFSRLGPPLQPPRQASLLSFSRLRFLSPSRHHLCSRFCYAHKLNRTNVRKNACRFPHSAVQVSAIDEDSADFSSLDHWGGGTAEYVVSSSDGEDGDGDYILSPVTDLDLPSANVSNNEALTMSAHRFGMIGRGRKTHRMRHGVFINLGLITFLTVLLLFADSCAWKIVRLPLAPFYLTCPFFVSLVLASSAGYICVPLLRSLKIHQIIRKEGPILHPKKRSTPTMGGLFFVPVGVAVAKAISGFSSTEVSGAAAATFAFAAIGFLDDILSLKKNHNSGLSAQLKLLLEVAVAICFSFWLDATSISSPYGMKMLVPLPAPLGLVCLGKYYLLLTSFCFVSMANGVNLTDGLDGLAGGTAALAFIGMSIAVLPVCSDLAIFGASMAGASVGFLLHNRYRASVFMGDTGSLALGGALAAMAACTGLFLPLFMSSGVFVIEALSVILQVSYFKATKHLQGAGLRLFRMAPFHRHLESCGLREPLIVAGAYIVSFILALSAGYVGLLVA